MKMFVAVLLGIVTFGAAAWAVQARVLKPHAGQRAADFIKRLSAVPLEDREFTLDRFMREDPEAGACLRIGHSGNGVRFII